MHMGGSVDHKDPVFFAADQSLDVAVDPYVTVEVAGDESICSNRFGITAPFGRNQPPANSVGLYLWGVEVVEVLDGCGAVGKGIIIGSVIIVDPVPIA